ncbi:hypothetical protein PAMP_000933 [Pampus punctatissimus]
MTKKDIQKADCKGKQQHAPSVGVGLNVCHTPPNLAAMQKMMGYLMVDGKQSVRKSYRQKAARDSVQSEGGSKMLWDQLNALQTTRKRKKKHDSTDGTWGS